MARPPSQKGTSVLPVVLALREHPGGRSLVPYHLQRKYLDEPILVSGWYPEQDYWLLIDALVKTVDPATAGGDVWRYFARFSAQRDIGGVYRSFAQGDAAEPEGFFRRAVRLWGQYHDTGKLEVVGSRPETNAVVMRLAGFFIPIEGFVRLQGYYLEEFGRLVGLEVKSTVTRSTARGDALCEWVHELGRASANDAYVKSLPRPPA